MPKSDPYRRNNAVGAAHLQMAGHQARVERWGGGTEGIELPHPDSPHHVVAIGQSPDTRDGSWQFRVHRDPEDPGYAQEGLHLGRTQMNRIPSPGPEKKQPRDDYANSVVTSHPRDLPDHLQTFLEHPQVRKAVKDDAEAIRRRDTLGPQFRPRGAAD